MHANGEFIFLLYRVLIIAGFAFSIDKQQFVNELRTEVLCAERHNIELSVACAIGFCFYISLVFMNWLFGSDPESADNRLPHLHVKIIRNLRGLLMSEFWEFKDAFKYYLPRYVAGCFANVCNCQGSVRSLEEKLVKAGSIDDAREIIDDYLQKQKFFFKWWRAWWRVHFNVKVVEGLIDSCEYGFVTLKYVQNEADYEKLVIKAVNKYRDTRDLEKLLKELGIDDVKATLKHLRAKSQCIRITDLAKLSNEYLSAAGFSHEHIATLHQLKNRHSLDTQKAVNKYRDTRDLEKLLKELGIDDVKATLKHLRAKSQCIRITDLAKLSNEYLSAAGFSHEHIATLHQLKNRHSLDTQKAVNEYRDTQELEKLLKELSIDDVEATLKHLRAKSQCTRITDLAKLSDEDLSAAGFGDEQIATLHQLQNEDVLNTIGVIPEIWVRLEKRLEELLEQLGVSDVEATLKRLKKARCTRVAHLEELSDEDLSDAGFSHDQIATLHRLFSKGKTIDLPKKQKPNFDGIGSPASRDTYCLSSEERFEEEIDTMHKRNLAFFLDLKYCFYRFWNWRKDRRIVQKESTTDEETSAPVIKTDAEGIKTEADLICYPAPKSLREDLRKTSWRYYAFTVIERETVRQRKNEQAQRGDHAAGVVVGEEVEQRHGDAHLVDAPPRVDLAEHDEGQVRDAQQYPLVEGVDQARAEDDENFFLELRRMIGLYKVGDIVEVRDHDDQNWMPAIVESDRWDDLSTTVHVKNSDEVPVSENDPSRWRKTVPFKWRNIRHKERKQGASRGNREGELTSTFGLETMTVMLQAAWVFLRIASRILRTISKAFVNAWLIVNSWNVWSNILADLFLIEIPLPEVINVKLLAEAADRFFSLLFSSIPGLPSFDVFRSLSRLLEGVVETLNALFDQAGITCLGSATAGHLMSNVMMIVLSVILLESQVELYVKVKLQRETDPDHLKGPSRKRKWDARRNEFRNFALDTASYVFQLALQLTVSQVNLFYHTEWLSTRGLCDTEINFLLRDEISYDRFVGNFSVVIARSI